MRCASCVGCLAVCAFAATPTVASEPERPRLAFSLDAALRLDAARAFDLADQSAAPGLVARRALTRIRPTLNHATSEGVTFLAQAQAYGANASASSRSTDLYQAYASFTGPSYDLRIGRQELVLGSGFLLGADEFFDGAAYDAVRVAFRPRPGLELAAFGGEAVASLSDGLGGSIAGVSVRAGGLEGYVVADGRSATSFGLRGTVERGTFAFEAEPVAQPGGAWGGHVEIAYAVARGAFRPRITLGYALASPEFLHPRHDTSQVGDLGVIGDLSSFSAGEATASGLRAASIGAELPFGRRTTLFVTLRDFGASEVAGASSRSVGREIDAVATFALSDLFSVAVSFDRFRGGAFYREATGEDLHARYGHVALRFRL